MSNSKSKLLLITNFSIVYFVWGMTFIWMKIAAKELHPFVVIFWQNLIAAIALIMLSDCKKFLSFFKKNFVEILSQSLFMLICGVGLITISVEKLPASFTAIIISSVPVWVVLFNGIKERKLSNVKLFGVILGFIGMIFLFRSEAQLNSSNNFYILLLVVASLSWSYGLFRMNKLSIVNEPYHSSGAQMLLAAFFYLVLILIFASESNFISINSHVIWSVVSLAILGSTVAFSSFNWLLKHSSPVKVSTYAYINPIVSILMAWIILGEDLNSKQAPYMAIMLFSVAIVVTERKKRVE